MLLTDFAKEGPRIALETQKLTLQSFILIILIYFSKLMNSNLNSTYKSNILVR